MTLSGHKESVSAVDWTEDVEELITSSWDHTLKLWDVEMGGMKCQVAGNKAFFDLSYSKLNRTAVTASADRHVRIYDPRSNGKVTNINFKGVEVIIVCSWLRIVFIELISFCYLQQRDLLLNLFSHPIQLGYHL